MKKFNLERYYRHETKRNVLIRFLFVFLLVIFYFIFVSYRFGVRNGFIVTLLSWSFFVLCTPIADAGFLLDFPLRIIGKIRMLYSEIGVWIFSLSLNAVIFFLFPQYYNSTFLLKMFYFILSHPAPFWLIIFLSAAGTFFSVYFGDELIDIVEHKERKLYKKHRKKHRLIILLFIIIVIISLYYFLIKHIGIEIPAT